MTGAVVMLMVASILFLVGSSVFWIQATNGGRRLLPGRGLAPTDEARRRISLVAAVFGTVVGVLGLLLSLLVAATA